MQKCTDSVHNLMRLVSDELFKGPTPFVEEFKRIHIPKDLSSQYKGPSKEVQSKAGKKPSAQPDQKNPCLSGVPNKTGCTHDQ